MAKKSKQNNVLLYVLGGVLLGVAALTAYNYIAESVDINKVSVPNNKEGCKKQGGTWDKNTKKCTLGTGTTAKGKSGGSSTANHICNEKVVAAQENDTTAPYETAIFGGYMIVNEINTKIAYKCKRGAETFNGSGIYNYTLEAWADANVPESQTKDCNQGGLIVKHGESAKVGTDGTFTENSDPVTYHIIYKEKACSNGKLLLTTTCYYTDNSQAKQVVSCKS